MSTAMSTTCLRPVALVNGFQALLIASSVSTVANNSPVIFNTPINSVRPNISYNYAGTFTINKQGTYFATWWVAGSTEAPANSTTFDL